MYDGFRIVGAASRPTDWLTGRLPDAWLADQSIHLLLIAPEIDCTNDLSIYLSTYLPTYLSIYLPTYLPIYLSIYLSNHLSVCLSVCQSINQSTNLSNHLSVYISATESNLAVRHRVQPRASFNAYRHHDYAPAPPGPLVDTGVT